MKKLIKTIILLTLISLIAGCGTQIQKTNNSNNTLDNAVDLIKQGKYADISISLLDGNEQSKAVYNYAMAKDFERDYNTPEGWLIDIPDNYNGVLSKEINEMKLKYKSSLDELKKKNEEEKNNPPKDLKLNPSVGMTADEVKGSSWGEPQHINRTTTTYGVSEQWVYDGKNFHSGYIYFEDGKVTAIQN